ncbi:MAG: hypothetical protein IPJ23_04165 [Ignavibacteriales bacterium]|nr:hypothetical protein [Ignavibacteriales bacterium]
MIKKIFLSSTLALIVFLLIGCNDSPTDLGVGFLNQDGIGVYKFDSAVDSIPQQSNYFKKVINLGSSDILLVGKAENVTAKTLLRFALIIPDSIKTEFAAQNLTVLDAYVELTKNYSFGDSSAVFDYEVYKINNSWSASTFTADSSLAFDQIDLSSNRTSSENDSIYSFHLDVSLAASWLQNYVDTSSASNNGIVLSPTLNSLKVIGFTAFNLNGINDPRLRIVVQKPGSYIDTLSGFISADISAVYGEAINNVTENLYIQSSLTSDAKLSFDLSVLPKDITISSANLTLTIDTLETKTGSSFSNSLIVFLLTDSVENVTSTSYFPSLSREGSTFKGDVTSIFRAWSNGLENQGMLIKASSDLRGVEIFAVKGSSAADLLQRPKLEIVYTRKK